MTPDSFVRLLRSNKSLYSEAVTNRKRIKIYCPMFELDLSKPSRRRQMVFVYDNRKEEELGKMTLFPKNFGTYLCQTIPDLAFFLFNLITYRASEEKELMDAQRKAVEAHGLRCIWLETETLGSLLKFTKPRKLTATCSDKSVSAALVESGLTHFESLDSIPTDPTDLLAAIRVCGRMSGTTTLWSQQSQCSMVEKEVPPNLKEHIKNIISGQESSGQMDLHFLEVAIEPFEKMLTELAHSHYEEAGGTKIFSMAMEEERKLVVTVQQDDMQVLLRYKVVESPEEFTDFVDLFSRF